MSQFSGQEFMFDWARPLAQGITLAQQQQHLQQQAQNAAIQQEFERQGLEMRARGLDQTDAYHAQQGQQFAQELAYRNRALDENIATRRQADEWKHLDRQDANGVRLQAMQEKAAAQQAEADQDRALRISYGNEAAAAGVDPNLIYDHFSSSTSAKEMAHRLAPHIEKAQKLKAIDDEYNRKTDDLLKTLTQFLNEGKMTPEQFQLNMQRNIDDFARARHVVREQVLRYENPTHKQWEEFNAPNQWDRQPEAPKPVSEPQTRIELTTAEHSFSQELRRRAEDAGIEYDRDHKPDFSSPAQRLQFAQIKAQVEADPLYGGRVRQAQKAHIIDRGAAPAQPIPTTEVRYGDGTKAYDIPTAVLSEVRRIADEQSSPTKPQTDADRQQLINKLLDEYVRQHKLQPRAAKPVK
jgi:hypothetical protein